MGPWRTLDGAERRMQEQRERRDDEQRREAQEPHGCAPLQRATWPPRAQKGRRAHAVVAAGRAMVRTVAPIPDACATHP